MAVVCKPNQGEQLTRKQRRGVNPGSAQEPGCAQNQHSGHAARQGLVGYTPNLPSVRGWALKQVTQKDSGISMLADVQIWIGKGSEQLALAVQGAQLHQEAGMETPATLPSHCSWKVLPVRRGVCSSGPAERFEALFRGQPLSWGHCNPKIQFLLCSHWSRELSATPNQWTLSPN